MTITVKIVDIQKNSEVVLIFEAKWHHTVKDVKDMIHKKAKIPPSRIVLFLLHKPSPLRNTTCLHDLCPQRSDSPLSISTSSNIDTRQPSSATSQNSVVTLRFATQNGCGCASDFTLDVVSDITDADVMEMSLVSNVKGGLAANKSLIKTEILDCTGGVYFFRNSSGQREGVFKPFDEEQGMPFNTKGHTYAPLRDNFQPGCGYLREYAAYCMDVEHRAQVPTTLLVQCKHRSLNYGANHKFGPATLPKLGSLQHFIANASSFDDYGYNAFSDYEIQKIALFDMRILNCDRNGGNILVVKHHLCSRSRMGSNVSDAATDSDENSGAGSEECNFDFDGCDNSPNNNYNNSGGGGNFVLECIPIDHGYAFPTQLCINDYDWAWFNCPQVDRPVDARLVDYLSSLNIDELIADLRDKTALPEECWFLIRTVHALLVEAVVKSHMTLKQVAQLIARLDDGVPSPLEKLIAEASENASRTIASRYDARTIKQRMFEFSAHNATNNFQLGWGASVTLQGAPLTKLHTISEAAAAGGGGMSAVGGGVGSSNRSRDSFSSFRSFSQSQSFSSIPFQTPSRDNSDSNESSATAYFTPTAANSPLIRGVPFALTPPLHPPAVVAAAGGAGVGLDVSYDLGAGVTFDSSAENSPMVTGIAILDSPRSKANSLQDELSPLLHADETPSHLQFSAPVVESDDRFGTAAMMMTAFETPVSVPVPSPSTSLLGPPLSTPSSTATAPRAEISVSPSPAPPSRSRSSSPVRLFRVASYAGFSQPESSHGLWKLSSEFDSLFRLFADKAVLKIVSRAMSTNSACV